MKEPPKLALGLLSLLVPASESESIPGDLTEEFQAIASEKSVRRANRWFWAQVVRSIGALAWMNARTAPRRTASAALAGLLVMGVGVAAVRALFVAMVMYLLGRYGFFGDPLFIVNFVLAALPTSRRGLPREAVLRPYWPSACFSPCPVRSGPEWHFSRIRNRCLAGRWQRCW
jgi:hypothetical protein